jgi:2-aminoethylphosphonate-pyruvate transaminase
MQQEHCLFCPGPVMVAPEVRLALIHKQICHRVPEFESVLRNTQENLLKIFKADDRYTVLLITGSGTAANETIISSQFTPKDKVLLVNNGVFGDRLEEILGIHDVPTTVIRYKWGERADPKNIEACLEKDPEITAIAMVFHETSTSVINPTTAVGALARRYKKRYFVDGVSAVGGEDLDVIRDNIDICSCSSNKCLGSLAGVGIICVTKAELETSSTAKPRISYLSLSSLYNFSERFHQTPNTPSVTMFIALDAAVKRLLREGLENQIERYRRCAKILRDGVGELGLEMLVDEAIASNTVTSVFLPPRIDMNAFLRELESKGFTVYPGKGQLLEKNMFQIANMGQVDEGMCRRFLKAFKETITE